MHTYTAMVEILRITRFFSPLTKENKNIEVEISIFKSSRMPIKKRDERGQLFMLGLQFQKTIIFSRPKSLTC